MTHASILRSALFFAFTSTATVACAPVVTEGSLRADISGDKPVFTLEGVKAGDTPTVLDVTHCQPNGDEQIVWEIEQRAGLPGSVTYGRVPDGGRELQGPKPLQEGHAYYAEVWAKDTRGDAWAVSFVWGDEDSVLSGDDSCVLDADAEE